MTFNLTSNGEGWLDPSSLRLHFRIVNTAPAGADAAANDLLGLLPAGGCHCFFSQLRILIGGTECERIEPYSLCHELFRVALNTPQSQVEQGVEDGRRFSQDAYPPLVPDRIPQGGLPKRHADSSRRVAPMRQVFAVEANELYGSRVLFG